MSTPVSCRGGDIGFPASRLMGSGIEIAVALEDASPFMLSEIHGRIKLKIEILPGISRINLKSGHETIYGFFQPVFSAL